MADKTMRLCRLSTLVLLFWGVTAPVDGAATGSYAITFYGSDSSCAVAVETVTVTITTLGEYSDCNNWAGGCAPVCMGSRLALACARLFVREGMPACM